MLPPKKTQEKEGKRDCSPTNGIFILENGVVAKYKLRLPEKKKTKKEVTNSFVRYQIKLGMSKKKKNYFQKLSPLLSSGGKD